MAFHQGAEPADAIPIHLVTAETWPDIGAALAPSAAAYAAACDFAPEPGRTLLLPAADGAISGVLFGVEGQQASFTDPFLCGKLATTLPARVYRFANSPRNSAMATLAWGLAAYKFNRYKKNAAKGAQLCPPDGVDVARITRIIAGVSLGRDLINTPANDLNPDAL